MSPTKTHTRPPINQPLQERSRVSLEKAMVGARTLMLQLGSEEFTLADVSETSGVSIGSIYLRFKTKDNLVRAVLINELEIIARQEECLIELGRAQSASLADFVSYYVDSFAIHLKNHAPLLQIAMQRASWDQSIAKPGRKSGDQSAHATAAVFASYAEQKDPRNLAKARTAYRIIFAALARELGLGSTRESAHWTDWDEFKRELSAMCFAYLTHAP